MVRHLPLVEGTVHHRADMAHPLLVDLQYDILHLNFSGYA